MTGLEGKVAIVTGSGRGIGRAHALALARAGAAVVVNDIGVTLGGEGQTSGGPAEAVAHEILSGGGRATADTTDISDWDAVQGLVDRAVRTFGRLDIVVNNAAIARFGTIDTIGREDWERSIAINLTGTAALSHAAARYWRAEGPDAGRRIVNTTSAMGLTPAPNNPMYVAAKAGVAGLTIACAAELAELGVRVNAIAPVARSRISELVAGDLMKPPADQRFDRMAPEHSATLVAYLASPACRFTGRVLGVIGEEIVLYDGWTVAQAFANGGVAWSADALAAALQAFPLQQQGQGHTPMGVRPLATPNAAVIETLAALEQA